MYFSHCSLGNIDGRLEDPHREYPGDNLVGSVDK